MNDAEYCDPTWTPEPNLFRALLGIDIAKKHPMPLKPEGDPSYPGGLIFNPMFRDLEFGNMDIYPFVTTTDHTICRAEFNEDSWETMDQFIKGSALSSMSDWNIGFTGPEITVEGEYEGVGGSITVPPNSASYGQGDSESSSSMEAFFNHERGSISHSQVKCSLYDVFVDIDEPSFSLHSSFVEAIKRIDLAVTEAEKKRCNEGIHL